MSEQDLEVYECAGCGGEVSVVEAVWLPRTEFRHGDPGRARPYCSEPCWVSNGSHASPCPPHDFGEEGLLEMLGRTCPKCGIEAAFVLGRMIADYRESPEPQEGK